MFPLCSSRVIESSSSGRAGLADQIVITEKASQAKDVGAAVGTRYGAILPAEDHLFDLLEPEDVVPAWKLQSHCRTSIACDLAVLRLKTNSNFVG